MSATIQGKTQPWFTINEYLSTDVFANTPIEVDSITAISFDDDVSITIGTLTVPFELPKGIALGIDASTNTIQIDRNAFMFAMGGR